MYSYQTPLGQAFMGRTVGEAVEVTIGETSGEWTIAAIRPWREAQ